MVLQAIQGKDFAPNHFDDDYEFVPKHLFEMNDDDDNTIVENQTDAGLDKKYFDQHYWSKSSDSYTEDTLNNFFILWNKLHKDNFPLLHINILGIPANLTGLLPYKSNIEIWLNWNLTLHSTLKYVQYKWMKPVGLIRKHSNGGDMSS